MTQSDETPKPGIPKSIARRGLILGGVTLLVAGGLAASQWFNINATISEGSLSVTDAHRKAGTGEIILIDIRRPDEWSRTGVGEGAHPIDMRDRDFEQQLLKVAADNRAAPIALICARGVRSRGLSHKLAAAGFTRIIDVPEGMLGSGAGPGWIKTGLPVVKL